MMISQARLLILTVLSLYPFQGVCCSAGGAKETLTELIP
jgi:hypothetical protein